MIESNKGECFVKMRMISGLRYTALHIGRTNGEDIVTGCITNLEAGIYNVDIFYINNNGEKDSSGKAVMISTVNALPHNQANLHLQNLFLFLY